MTDIDALLGQIVPAVQAAVDAYGVGVLARIEDQVVDETAGETVRLGQRLLDRILRRDASTAPVTAAVADLAGAAGDPDAEGALRLQIRKALREDPSFAAELALMLPTRPSVSAGGERSVAVGGDNLGIISTGDGARNYTVGAPSNGPEERGLCHAHP
ncbi:hypothetical protein [Streptomyces sp. BE230]|uniref:hypothetical protein n=1 Tax=Streptomyces sp. BE230 TaxID=3002526 RepID=UPI002ED66F3B|nr:hypothetical protein [Streptomyces sp. BE230]